MKTNIIGIIIALMLAFAGAVGALAQDAKVSEVRKVEGFSSIRVTSVAHVYFTQSDTWSLKIEGKEKHVKNTTSEVKGDCLVIGFKDGKKKALRNRQDGVTIYLSAPDLKEVDFTGVGSFNCTEPLKLDEVKLDVQGVGDVTMNDLTCRELRVSLQGVGEADIHVTCDYLSASLSGVGGVTLSGTAGHADISKGGIGSVNTKKLKIKNDE